MAAAAAVAGGSAGVAAAAAASPSPSSSLSSRWSQLRPCRPSELLRARIPAPVLRRAGSVGRRSLAARAAYGEYSRPERRREPLTFWEKLQAAIEIFFPKPKGSVEPVVDLDVESSARERAKKRLRMILVADRCALSPASMAEMKRSIVRALSSYVEIEKEDKVDLAVSSDPELGTIYSVSVPVRRVKPEFESERVGEGDGDLLRDFDPEGALPRLRRGTLEGMEMTLEEITPDNQ
eukprot:jgi/Chlat1/1264/Chrsp115S01697